MDAGEILFAILLLVFVILFAESCRCVHANCVTVTRLGHDR